MRHSTRITTFLVAVLAITATSCYTQLKTTSSYPGGGYYSSEDRVTSGDRSLVERGDQVVNEEDYTLGYDDGWSDAEAYYFKDYEAKRWYEEYGAALAHDPYVRHYTLNHYRYGRGFSPYHSYYYPHYPYYSHAYWSSRWTFALGFHVGWNHWYPHYSYHPYYDYYAYPGYYPYYGGYGWGYGGPFYGNTVVIYNGSRGTSGNYGPRSNGLTSRGSDIDRRTRSDARVRNTASRSDIRSNARSRNISGDRSRGTVNRSSGTTRSRSSSTVRSRSGSSNNRGTVNRGSSNRSRSSGSVNRSRSSSGGNNGSVNRSRSSSRSNGTVNRSRSSSSNRSSGTVNRSSNSNNSGSSSVRGRSSSRDNNRSLSSSRSSVLDRSSSTIGRTPFSGAYIGKDYNRLSSAVQDDVTNRAVSSRRERAINMIRNQISSPSGVEVPTRNVNRGKSSRDNRSNLFDNRAVRSLFKAVVGSNGSSSRSSSVQRSASGSSGRSSSVSRSRSNNSSRSTVRSSRNSSSSRSSGSSRRSRSSSSRDRN